VKGSVKVSISKPNTVARIRRPEERNHDYKPRTEPQDAQRLAENPHRGDGRLMVPAIFDKTSDRPSVVLMKNRPDGQSGAVPTALQ